MPSEYKLRKAARDGDLARVKEALSEGADIHDTTDSGGTALMYAAECGNLEIVKFLIETGADLAPVNKWNQTALDCAVFRNHADVVKFLLQVSAPTAQPTDLRNYQGYLEREVLRQESLDESSPARSEEEGEVFIKIGPKPKSSDKSNGHRWGGFWPESPGCLGCGGRTNLVASFDLRDPAISDSLQTLDWSALPNRKFPVFWCLTCSEWDASFFDFSKETVKSFGGVETNEASFLEPLTERLLIFDSEASDDEAEAKSKLGGSPTWIQGEEPPDCPKCQKTMVFLLQLASNAHISFGDVGMLYVFACRDCQVSATLVQSH
jgi:hypothetical protein